MTAISTSFTALSYAFGSLLTSAKMTQLMDNTTFNKEWIGASFVGGAIQDHNHDDVNSKAVTLPSNSVTSAMIQTNAVGQDELAADAVGIAQLKDSSGEVSVTGSSAQNLTLPGGSYGFYPQVKNDGGSFDTCQIGEGITSTSFVTNIHIARTGGGTSYARHEYLTASAPYSLGNGDIPIFVFALIDSSGNVIATYAADTPPWVYNGRPENTFNPKKYKRKAGKANFFYDRLVMPDKSIDFEIYLDALDNPQNYMEEIEITPENKNLDMDIIPHPFIGSDMMGKSVVLLEPVGSMAEKMRNLHDMGESVADLLQGRYLLIDNEDAGAISPIGVKTHKVKWKNG